MFSVFKFKHRWNDAAHTQVVSQIVYNSICLALVRVHLETETVDFLSGNLNELSRHIPPIQEQLGKTKTELIIEGVKKSARLWAERVL